MASLVTAQLLFLEAEAPDKPLYMSVTREVADALPKTHHVFVHEGGKQAAWLARSARSLAHLPSSYHHTAAIARIPSLLGG